MAHGLDLIIVDDDPAVSRSILSVIQKFYSWGEVIAFSDAEEAKVYCLTQDSGVAIFVLDVFMGNQTGFAFLDAISEKFPMAHEDAIMITGKASDDVVNMCVASDINHLLEKPIKPYALQLAVRSIVSKYIKFAKKLLQDPTLLGEIESL